MDTSAPAQQRVVAELNFVEALTSTLAMELLDAIVTHILVQVNLRFLVMYGPYSMG